MVLSADKKLYFMNKILKNLEKLPFDSDKVCVVGGHFDLIHPGHIRFLQECKRQSDGPLVVLLANDESTRMKKSGRPIMLENDRAEMLAALECVDYVYVFSTQIEGMPTLFEHMSPKKVFFSIDPNPSTFTEKVKRLLMQEFPQIQVVDVPRQRSDISTTQIIEKIYASNKQPKRKTIILRNAKEIKDHLTSLSKISGEDFKVAAILLNEVTGEVQSEGHNSVAKVDKQQVVYRKEGTPEHSIGGPRAFHAEAQAICNFINTGKTNFADSTLFSKVEPCAGCAQMIAYLGIKKVRYFEDFDNNYGTLILNSEGVDVEKIII